MSPAVLVTGSAGMVGSHLVEHLRAAGEMVIATYLRPTIPADEVDRLQPLVELDVRDAARVSALIAEHRPAKIFHLAAQSYPTLSWELPRETIDINVGGTINLYEGIKAVRKTEPPYDPLVVNACSSAAYGATLRPENVPIREDALLQPLHPYGVSKAAHDMLAYQYFVNDGIRGVRARIFNSTGPRKTNDVVSDFCSRSADIVMVDGPLRVGNLDTQRAILDVADLVQALLLLADRGRPAEAYNICADRACRVGDIVGIIEGLGGRKLKLISDPALFRPTDEPIIFGDTTKLKQETGWAPTLTLAQTVERVFLYELRRRSGGIERLGSNL